MAREAVARTRRNAMAHEKSIRHSGKAGFHSSVKQSQSLINVSELEHRAKATVNDITELYAALQSLVPKKSTHNGKPGSRRQSRKAVSGTDNEVAKSSDDWNQPRVRRRYHSEKLPKKTWSDRNMNYTKEKTVEETPVVEKTLSNEQLLVSNEQLLVASDTEAELHNASTNEHHKIHRQSSLPIYEEESANEVSNETNAAPKRSRFTIFRRRHRARTKSGKKKGSSWRSFFSTLSLQRQKTKRRGKNKVAHSVTTPLQNSPKHQVKKNVSLPLEAHASKPTPRPSLDTVDGIGKDSQTRQSGRRRIAPDPPILTSGEEPGNDILERRDTMETKSDQVQKKLSAWYKHAVEETNTLLSKNLARATRSCENMLTDSEIMRKRGTLSSDTESASGTDRNRVNVPKTRVRKTRAKRNRRRKERARFHSLPNVKLVTKAVNEVDKANTIKTPADCNETTKDELTDDPPHTPHVATVKPLEAKLSFGSTLDKAEPLTDFMKLQKENNGRDWLTRQCSRTTISCIRPLQLNLFYSESPSRETVHRTRTAIRRPRVARDGQGTGNDPLDFAFKIRRSSSRRRKRRSLKRQSRLPHQSPFYAPPSNLNLALKDLTETDVSISKDSGLGSPDSLHDKKFATFPVMKRDQPLNKQPSESDDSGWASRDRRHFANKADTAIQTEPVIVMTAVSRVRRISLPRAINKDKSQSEV